MKYKAAVIGLGQIGFKIDLDSSRRIIWSHVKAYDNTKNIDLIAVSEINKDNILTFKKYYPKVKVYEDYIDLLEKNKIDIISICTPTKTHLKIIEKILKIRRPKVIFCEKPVGRDYEECEEIIKLCTKYNVILSTNYMRRWDARFIQISQIIKDEKIGKLTSLSAYGTSALLTSTSHLIDILLMYGGYSIDWLIGELQQDYVRTAHGEKDPGGNAFVKFSNGSFGYLKGSSTNSSNYMFEIDLLFSQGRITIADDAREISIWEFSDKETSTGTGYKTLVKSNEIKIHSENERMLAAIENLIDSIEKNSSPLSNGLNALEVHKFINGIKISNKNSKKINYIDIYA